MRANAAVIGAWSEAPVQFDRDRLTAEERLSDIVEILAHGLLWLMRFCRLVLAHWQFALHLLTSLHGPEHENRCPLQCRQLEDKRTSQRIAEHPVQCQRCGELEAARSGRVRVLALL